MSLLVTGSIAIDSVTTPHGTAENVLGGSAVYFCFAASYFTEPRLVCAVGEDFPDEFKQVLEARKIDLAGLEVRKGSKTFRWQGKYVGDMNEAETTGIDLNILMEDNAKIPESFADSKIVFLAATHPTAQREFLKQVPGCQLSVADTRDLWIENEHDELIKTLGVVDGVIINDGEAKQLTGKVNLIEAAGDLLKMGPKFAVVKKGEHGALLLTSEGATVIPAYPTLDVKDPTGAGDAFAGGMLGYLAATMDVTEDALRRAIVRGTVVASLTIEDFSLNRIANVTPDEVDQRIRDFVKMLRIEG